MALILAVASFPATADTPPEPPRDLTELPIEALLDIEVTTASRKAEKLSETPAAVSVITQDEIRRSGVTSIPEALRLAPGLDVARVDSSEWAISARGFNDVFANKLLVLQDGRSVYTPLFSGVFWADQGTMMEDIERIEVNRGPGATLWGANAVNGVISIITRSAKDTQGTLVTGGGGSEERGFGGVRYGDKLGEHAYFRVYGTYFNRDDSILPNGMDANDAWQMGRWGFRVDWDVSDRDLVTVQGDAYRGEVHETFTVYDPSNSPSFVRSVPDRSDLVGGNFLARWSHTFSPESSIQLQTYYDHTERNPVIFQEKRDTFDVDFQHTFAIGHRNDVVWGAGYRFTTDDVGNSPTVSLISDSRSLHLFSGFVQDELTIIPDRLKFSAGSKFEHNDFTGFEVQPGARLLWTPHPLQTVWASVSRAVRTPSRVEEDIILNQVQPPGALFPGSPPAVTTIYGTDTLKAEELRAYEIGYRVQLHRRVSLELAAFYNDYDRLRSIEPGPSATQPLAAPPPAPAVAVPFHTANELFGETYGAEVAATIEAASWWRLQPSYTFLDMQLHRQPGSLDMTSEQDEGRSPRNQASLRSFMDFPHAISLECALRYVDNLPALQISSYVEFDARIAWWPRSNLELAVVGQNLISPHHAEFRPSFIATQQTEVQRGVYGKLTWHF